MCEPVSMGIMAGVTLIGAGVQAYGAYEQGQAANRAALKNKEFALIAAGDARQRGQMEAGSIRMGGTRMVGNQQVLHAASGVDSSEGSAAKMAHDTRLLAELDVAQTMNNAAREAWGLKEQSTMFGEQAQAIRSQTGYAIAGSILGGLGQASGQVYGMGKSAGWWGGGK